jgi:formate transporter
MAAWSKKERRTKMNEPMSLDALLPPAMAEKAESLGVKKANLAVTNVIALAILAGAFIGVGAIFSTTVAGGSLPYGLSRLLIGLVFSVGLVLVVVGGAELFTGNILIVMAFASKKISLLQLLRNWGLVYLGNFVGAILTAYIVFLGKQYTFGSGTIGLTALNIANAKMEFTFVQAVALGSMCNALVCMAVWLCYSARTTTDKILAIILPVSCFVAAGFEHSIANMYFIPMGLFIKDFAPEFLSVIGKTAADYANLTWGNFFVANLLPVTIGNIIGGALMVGLIYWFIYNRKSA